MKNIFSTTDKGLEMFNANLNLRVPIVASYLLLMLVLREILGVQFLYITFFLVSLMMISSLAVAFYFDKTPLKRDTITKIFFFYTAFDLFLLTSVIYYLGGVVWIGFIFYSFYLILNFMIFPRWQAIALTAWIIFLYLAMASLQFFKILPFYFIFPPGIQTVSNFSYVLSTLSSFVLTFVLVAYYSHGFYQSYAGKISELNAAKETLENERISLEKKVGFRIKELEKEKKGLGVKIRDRKKELEREELALEEKALELERFKKIVVGREKKLKILQKDLEELQKNQSI